VSEPLALLGPDHDGLGEVSAREAPGGRFALAISRGRANRALAHGNEDACGLAFLADGRLLAIVADAHFGDASSRVLVETLIELAGAPGGRLDLVFAFREASRRLAAAGSRSECAAVAALVDGRRVAWAAVGDCRAYHVPKEAPEKARELTPVGDRYLGRYERSPEVATGEATLWAGDRLVLATDGLPECVYGVETLEAAEVGALAARGAPLPAARALVERALERGGEDNVAVAVLELLTARG